MTTATPQPCRGLVKFPDSKIKILNNISLTVNQGDAFFIEGPNGSGKQL
jgi:ABC-type molybdenum transport system ATPase subunit/photorepair protein PhrA